MEIKNDNSNYEKGFKTAESLYKPQIAGLILIIIVLIVLYAVTILNIN